MSRSPGGAFRAGLESHLAEVERYAQTEVNRLQALVEHLQQENETLAALVDHDSIHGTILPCPPDPKAERFSRLEKVTHVNPTRASGEDGTDVPEEPLKTKSTDDSQVVLVGEHAVHAPKSAPPKEAPDPEAAPPDCDHVHDFPSERQKVSKSEASDWDAATMKASLRRAKFKSGRSRSTKYLQTGFAANLVQSQVFEQLTVFVICANSLWIWIDLDMNEADSILSADPLFVVMDVLFSGYFAFELIIRFVASENKRRIYRDGWFVFDFILVSFLVVETWVLSIVMWLAGTSNFKGLGNASVLRMFRLLRLTRMAKIMRHFPEVMVIIKGMVAGIRSVLIITTVLMVNTYIFAIVFKQLTLGSTVGEEYYSTVPEGMFSLIVEGLLPDNSDMIRSLRMEDWFLSLLFVIFLFLSAFTIMNMLIGFMCDVVAHTSESETEKSNIFGMTERLKVILKDIDTDFDGQVSRNEVRGILTNEDALQTLQGCGVDVRSLVDEADAMFDDDGVSFEEFVDMVLQFRGNQTVTVGVVAGMRNAIHTNLLSIEERLTRIDKFLTRTLASPIQVNHQVVGAKQFSGEEMVI